MLLKYLKIYFITYKSCVDICTLLGFKGQACVTIEDETYRLSRSVGNYQSTLRKIPEERRFNPHRGGSLKSHEKLSWQDRLLLQKISRDAKHHSEATRVKTGMVG